MATRDPERYFDRRTIKRHLKRGVVSETDFGRYIETLPDVSDKIKPRDEGGDDDGYDGRGRPKAAAPAGVSATMGAVGASYDDDDDFDDDDFDDDDDDDGDSSEASVSEAGVSQASGVSEASVSSSEAGVSSSEAGVSSSEAGVSSSEAGVSSSEASVSGSEASGSESSDDVGSTDPG